MNQRLAQTGPASGSRQFDLDCGCALDPAMYTALKRLGAHANQRLVLSLGGGALPGLCGNIALLRILEELDMRSNVRQVWGTSAGAIAGGAWATGSSAAEILEIVFRLRGRGSVDICWLRLVASLPGPLFGRPLVDGLVRGRHFARRIARSLRVASFEECEIPFRCIVASDDGRARRKVLREGELLPAILASMNLPGVFLPIDSPGDDEESFCDGGLVEKTPLLSPIAEHRLSRVSESLVLLATHFGTEARKGRTRGFINRFVQSIYAVEDQLWEYQLADARERQGVTILLANPCLADPALFDFSRIEENYGEARSRFLAQLCDAKIVRLLAQG